jgi:hypothetical protein
MKMTTMTIPMKIGMKMIINCNMEKRIIKKLLSDIMDTNLKVKKIDSSDPEVIRKIEECKKKQQECLNRGKVDWEKLRKTYITI